MGAFGFIAENLYFISTSHVVGSNTSASSWEPLRRVIQHLISIFSKRDDLVDKHRDLLNLLKWLDDLFTQCEQLTRAHPCKLNQGINDDDKLTVVIYVDDILGTMVSRKNMKRLLAAIIEETQYCSLSVSLISQKVGRINSWPKTDSPWPRC
jgi:hypothetical protein